MSFSRNKPAALKILQPSGEQESPPEERDGVAPECCDILRDALRYTRVGNVVPKKVIYALKPSASLATCMHLFAEKRILAAPVYVVSTTEDDYFDDEDGVWTEMVGTETKCIALVNQIDLIHYINSLSLSKQAKLAQMRLGDVIEWQSFDRDISVPIRASVFKLMWFFSRATTKALLSDNAQACGIISLADINCYVADLLDKPESLAIHSVANSTIEQAGFGKDAFATCSGEISVVEAIDILFKKRVGALAVMDEKNGLIGEFSPRDLRGVGPNSFYRLKGKLVNYLATFCPTSLKPITVTPDTSVGECTRILADADKHFVWIVNEMFEPEQVVTLSDVMRLARRGVQNSKATNLQTPRSQWSTIQSPAGATPGPSFDDEEKDFPDPVNEEDEEEEEELDEDNENDDEDEGDDDEDDEDDDDSDDYNPNLVADKDLQRLDGEELSAQNVAVVTPREIQEAIWIPTEDEPVEEDEEEEEEKDVGEAEQFHEDAHTYATEIAQDAYEAGADPVQAYDDAYDHFEEAAITEAEAAADSQTLHEEAISYATEQADMAEDTGYDPEETFNEAYEDYTEAAIEDAAIHQDEEQTEDIKAYVHNEASAFAEDKAQEAYEHGMDPEEAYSEAYDRYNHLAANELEESEVAAEEEIAQTEYEQQLAEVEEEEYEAEEEARAEAMGQYAAEPFETESAMEDREAYQAAVQHNMQLRELDALALAEEEAEREAYENEMYERQQQAAFDEARLAEEEEKALESARQEAYEDAAAYEDARDAAYDDAAAYTDAREAAVADAEEAVSYEEQADAIEDANAYDDSRERALQDAEAYEDARQCAIEDAVAYEDAADQAHENAAIQTVYEQAAYDKAREAAYADTYEEPQQLVYPEEQAAFEEQAALEEQAAYEQAAYEAAQEQNAYEEQAAYEQVAYEAEQEQAAYEQAAFEAEEEAAFQARMAAQEDAAVMQEAQPQMSPEEEEMYIHEMEEDQQAYEEHLDVEEEEQELRDQGFVKRADYGYEYQPTPEEALHLSPEEQAEVAVSKFEATYVLLKAIRNLNNAGHLSSGQKSHLKNLTVSQAPLMIDSALRYLHTRDDYEFYSNLIETAEEVI